MKPRASVALAGARMLLAIPICLADKRPGVPMSKSRLDAEVPESINEAAAAGCESKICF